MKHRSILPHELGEVVEAVRPFVAAHPEMRIARWAQDADPGGRVAAIRLVKDDDGPAKFGLEDRSQAFGHLSRVSGKSG